MICFTPLALQVSISAFLISRDALAMSIVLSPAPWQNCFRPPEEPPEPTTGGLKFENALPNSSATIAANGRTVEEPAIWIVSRLWAEAGTARAAVARTSAAALVKVANFMGGIPVASAFATLGEPLSRTAYSVPRDTSRGRR